VLNAGFTALPFIVQALQMALFFLPGLSVYELWDRIKAGQAGAVGITAWHAFAYYWPLMAVMTPLACALRLASAEHVAPECAPLGVARLTTHGFNSGWR
jgi:hypothetical protein